MKGLKIDGAPSIDELRGTPGYPGIERARKGSIAFIECIEEIPCNPCETACLRGAIKVGRPITNLPQLDEDKCTGCALCVAACPGLAIYVKTYDYREGMSLIKFPYEYLPLPEEGREVELADRYGNTLCKGKVIKVDVSAKNNRTAIVWAEYPQEYFEDVVTMIRL
ncbi:MAG: 4Fe-4S binding protein [Bacillota bacterium]|nr:4Fe-4S binding protein [Bacillota bacterium]